MALDPNPWEDDDLTDRTTLGLCRPGDGFRKLTELQNDSHLGLHRPAPSALLVVPHRI
jgi:hypothetical protein